MQITKSRLKQIIKEELRKEGFFGGKKKKFNESTKQPTPVKLPNAQALLNGVKLQELYNTVKAVKNSDIPDNLNQELVTTLDELYEELHSFFKHPGWNPFSNEDFDSMSIDLLIGYVRNFYKRARDKRPEALNHFKNYISKALNGYKTDGVFNLTIRND